MPELGIRVPNPAPAVSEQIEIRLEVNVNVRETGIVVKIKQQGRGQVSGLPEEVRFSGDFAPLTLRAICVQSGPVRLRAISEPVRVGLGIPDLRNIDRTGRAEWPGPTQLMGNAEFKIRPTLPAPVPGACRTSEGSTSIPSEERDWWNWQRTRVKPLLRTVVLGTFAGTMAERVADVVEAVQTVEANGLKPGIQGSGWSYTDCVVSADTTVLIDTSFLSQSLGGIVLDTALRPDSRNLNLVHVEAGIKIHELNCLLDSMPTPMAMPTLGGSRGQSIAGVISTGVHGSDIALPPVADAVRAIHLVGPGGQEWWIEPEADCITDALAMARLRINGTFCRHIRIEYSDDLFNSTLVSMGCAGIIYSVVLATRPRFNLRTICAESTWDEARDLIGDIERRRERSDYVDINVIAPRRSCRIIRRTVTADAITAAPINSRPIEDIARVVGFLGPGALAELIAEAGRILAQLSALLPRLAVLDPFAFVELATLGLNPGNAQSTYDHLKTYFDLLTSVSLDVSHPEQVAVVLPRAINFAWTIGLFNRSGRDLVDALQQQLTLGAKPDEDSVKTSFGARTGQSKCPDPQEHTLTERLVESFEYATSPAIGITFVERALTIIDDLRRGPSALVVNINLRFTRKSRAVLAMQQYDPTCHIEVYTFKGVAGNAAFHSRLHALARELAVIPHWGQLHDTTFDFSRAYGGRLATWRWAMNHIATGGIGKRDLFFTKFARDRKLIEGPIFLLGSRLLPEPPGVRGIVAASDAEGRVDLFGIGLGHQLWTLGQSEPDGDFGPWRSHGGEVKEVKALTRRSGQLHVFAVGRNSSLLHIRQQGDGYSAWSSLGGSVRAIEVARNADGRLEAFVVGSDSALHHIYENAAGGAWSDWESLGGVVKRIAVGSNQDGRLEVFAIGADDALHHRYQIAPNSGWSNWGSLGGVVKQIAVGSNQDGRLEVFAIGADDALHHIYQVVPNSGWWSNWSGLGGVVRSLAVSRNRDGRLEVFAVGSDDAVHHIHQLAPNSGWGAWSSLGGEVVKEVTVHPQQDGRLEVYAVSAGFELHRVSQVAPSARWGTWSSLGLPTR